jgi:hypothetical protein
MKPIEGKIAAIIDTTTVVINKGRADGVKRDEEFYVYTELGPFFDPDTGENLGGTKSVWGRVHVTILEERFCVAETGWTWESGPMDWRKMFGEKVQIELPVAEEDIADDWLLEVKVGTPVVSVVRQATLESNDEVALLEPAVQDKHYDVDVVLTTSSLDKANASTAIATDSEEQGEGKRHTPILDEDGERSE